MKEILISLLFLIFISGSVKSENDSLNKIQHSFNLSAALSGDFDFIGVYNPSYRLYFKRNVFSIGPNFTNRDLSLSDLYKAGFQLSGFSVGYRCKLGKIKKHINFSFALDGIYNYLNEKIIVRSGSVYEVYLGLEIEANLSKRLYLDLAGGLGLSYRNDWFDFPIAPSMFEDHNIGGVALVKFGLGYKF